MAVANLGTNGVAYEDKDSIVIQSVLETHVGGVALDVTGFTPEVINAGHVIVKDGTTGDLKPLAISSGAYAALTSGDSYYGIAMHSVKTSRPITAVLVRGSVLEGALPYAVTSAIKTALPHIRFISE